MKINTQAIVDNVQHVAGIIVGKLTKASYTKEQRSTKWFSTVAANQATQDEPLIFMPYKIIIK